MFECILSTVDFAVHIMLDLVCMVHVNEHHIAASPYIWGWIFCRSFLDYAHQVSIVPSFALIIAAVSSLLHLKYERKHRVFLSSEEKKA